MAGLIGRKIGMTQMFTDDGKAVGVTVLEVGPCPVVQVKTIETDGYEAIQLGFGRRKEKRAKMPTAGHAARAGLDYVPEILAEFLPEQGREYEAGEQLTVDIFEVGQRVKLSGRTKGRGFQGTVKRHGFAGGRASHGGSSALRKPGSIGPGTDPSRVIKGRKMSGQMGGTIRTAMNRKIVAIDVEKNLLMISGSVPGARNNVVLIRTA
jgi:large subunit ribosomal protein L3